MVLNTKKALPRKIVRCRKKKRQSTKDALRIRGKNYVKLRQTNDHTARVRNRNTPSQCVTNY